jgi:hypothetical protein
MAGFDLTTHNFESRDDTTHTTTKPKTQGNVFEFSAGLKVGFS